MRLLFCFFISFLVQSNPNISFKKPLNFNADININSEGNSISMARCHLEMEHLFII